MYSLSNYELSIIKGGGINTAAIAYIIGAAVTFVIGVLGGYKRPYSCGSGK